MFCWVGGSFAGRFGQGNGGGESVSGADGVADDEVEWVDGILQDGVGVGAVRWAAGFWKLQGLTRVEVGDVEVVHGAGAADVFPEGWFH